MTKDETRQALHNYLKMHIQPCLVSRKLGRDQTTECVDDGMSYAEDYAAACVTEVTGPEATLRMLEVLAREGVCAEWTNVLEDGSCVTLLVTYVGDGEYVYSQGVSGGIEYSAVHGDVGCTRAEALALLEKGAKDAG